MQRRLHRPATELETHRHRFPILLHRPPVDEYYRHGLFRIALRKTSVLDPSAISLVSIVEEPTAAVFFTSIPLRPPAGMRKCGLHGNLIWILLMVICTLKAASPHHPASGHTAPKPSTDDRKHPRQPHTCANNRQCQPSPPRHGYTCNRQQDDRFDVVHGAKA